MKLTKSFLGLSLAAFIGVVALTTLHFTCWAREAAPQVHVETTPINRDAKLGTSFAPVVKKVAPSVVTIFSTRFVKPRRNPFADDPVFRQFFGGRNYSQQPRKEEGLGSGVIISSNGYILTANHVVDGADEIQVSIADNKKTYPVKLIGKDAATDIAVLKIDAENLPAVTLADSDQLEVGDMVLAVGNPFGVGQTVTMGIVSALGRNGLGFSGYQNFIQTDAAINPGNSGGALVDVEGRLVGINTAIISPSGANNGIGLAVPINMARTALERFLKGGKITRGYLGVNPQDIDDGLAQSFNLPDLNGALVGGVQPNSPAAKAGVKDGDVIVAINGKTITGADNLKVVVSQLDPDTEATVKLIRNGDAKTITVKLGALPEPGASTGGLNNSQDQSDKTDALDGVSVSDIDDQVRQQLHLPTTLQGAVVTDVDRDSNAHDADLRVGDVIIAINNQTVDNSDAAVRICQGAEGKRILLKIWRQFGDLGGTRYLSVDNTKRKN